MPRARIFRSGNSQAVRLPKEFRFRSQEVEIFRRGEEVVLREVRPGLGRVLDLLQELPDEIFSGIRDDRPPEPV